MTPPKTPAVLALRIVLLMVLGGLGSWGILAGHPVSQITPGQQEAIGWFRLAYGLFFAFRLQRALPGVSLVLGWQKAERVTRIYHVWTFVCLCLAAGFLTPVMLVAHWLFITLVQRHNKAYSVEDVLNRLPGFGLFLLNSHLALAVDAQLGFTYGLTSAAPTGVNFFIWTFLAIMFSTGYEKLWSPLWQKGLGFYQFISIPYTTRPWFRSLRRWKLLCMALSWSALILEIGLIFTGLHREALVVGAAISVLFGLTLTSGITPFFFVGGATVWASAFVMVMALKAEPLPFIAPKLGGWLLLALYWTGCVALMNFSKIRGGLVSKLMDFTVHMRPYVLFNEVHYYGLYIFRIMALTPEGKIDCLRLFTEEGLPGPMQPFRPVALYASYTRLTDYCIAMIHDQKQRLEFYGKVLDDLGWAAQNQLPADVRGKITDMRLEVRVYDPPSDYDPDTCPWRCDWTDIGRFDTENSAIRFVPEGTIPHYGKTVRWPVLWN